MADGAATVPIEELVSRYAQDVYRYAYRLAGSAPDAEDLTQETFLAAVKNLSQLANPDAAKSWLFTILRNQFLAKRRRASGINVQSLGDAATELVAAPEPSDEIDGELVQKALMAIPDDHRVILLMFYFEEASYKEISQQLGIPMGTVMSRLSRAKEALRKRLLTLAREPN